MLADLDLLLTSVFCTADDLLPERPTNARRSLTDAEVVTLCPRRIQRRVLQGPVTLLGVDEH